MKNQSREIKVKHIIVQSLVGGQIERCIKESIQLAIEHDIDVILFHNDNKYSISIDDIVNGIWNNGKGKKPTKD